MAPPRWDGDERGEGVADAAAFAAGAGELVETMRRPCWVAEEPEKHLLPHLERVCGSLPVELVEARTGSDGVFEVGLRWTGPEPRQAEVRSAAFVVLGAFAEAATYVGQRRDGPGEPLLFEIVTGMLEGQSRFAPHGHTVRLRIDAPL